MFKKLKTKFIATIMILLTSIVLLIFTALYVGMNKNGQYVLFSQLSESLNSIKVSPSGEIMGRPHQEKDIIIAVYDVKNSRLIYSSSYGIDESEVILLVDNASNMKKDRGIVSGTNEKFAYICKTTHVGVEVAFKSAQLHENTMDKLVVISIVIGVISLIVLFIVSIVIANKAIKPVEDSYNKQKRFIADASHELKTPLATIKTNLDILNSNGDDLVKNQSKWLEYIDFQTDRMSKLVNNLLYLAKSDNNEQLGTKVNFNISDSIMKQLLTFEATIYENDLGIDYDIQENIEIYGDKEAFNQLVGILVDNAIKHSYKNTNINVSLKKEKQKLIFSVINNGDTIPQDEQERIFDRFYRVDKDRARETGGYGLGLSIAKSIVDKYKGKISVLSKDNITNFKVEIPITKDVNKSLSNVKNVKML